MKRSKTMQNHMNALSDVLFNEPKPQESIGNKTCVSCKGVANEFRDEVSKREFGISGLCQKCQDSIFGVK